MSPWPTNSPPDALVAARYVLGRRIGQGTYSTVWQAADLRLHRFVAIKAVRLPETVAAGVHVRLLEAARAATRLAHPAAAGVLDVVEEGGAVWVVSQLVPAPSVAELVAQVGRLPVGQVAAVGGQVLAALCAAHHRGLVHHDVHPVNVLVEPDGRAKLVDFGGEAIKSVPALAAQRASPPLLQPASHGPESDLRALGATLWFAVSGSAPEPGAAAVADVAGPLTPVIRALLAATAYARPRSTELMEQLDRIASGRLATTRWPRALPAPATLADLPEDPRTEDRDRPGAPGPAAPQGAPAAGSGARADERPRQARETGNGRAYPPGRSAAPKPTRQQTPPSTGTSTAAPGRTRPHTTEDRDQTTSTDSTTKRGGTSEPAGTPQQSEASRTHAPQPGTAAAEPGTARTSSAAPANDRPRTTGQPGPHPRRPAAAPGGVPGADGPDTPTARADAARSQASAQARPEPAGAPDGSQGTPAAAPGGTPASHGRAAAEAARAATGPSGRSPLRRLPELVLLIVVVLTAAAALGDRLADQGARPQVAPGAAAARSGAAGGVTTPGWREHTDPAGGFTVAVPTGWRRLEDNVRDAVFTEPRTGAAAAVTRVQGPPGDLATIARQAERNYRGLAYRRIRLTRTLHHGHPAVLWEFTFNGGGVTIHASDLHVHAGRDAYVLSFQVPAARWEATRPVREGFSASFRAP